MTTDLTEETMLHFRSHPRRWDGIYSQFRFYGWQMGAGASWSWDGRSHCHLVDKLCKTWVRHSRRQPQSEITVISLEREADLMCQ